MTSLSFIKDALDSGHPVVRKWPLVESYYLPFVLCAFYVLFVKRLGPAFMEKKQPMELRRLMILYNFGIVFAYSASLLTVFYFFLTTVSYKYICSLPTDAETDDIYRAARVLWVFYFLKYLEFADTVFFVLRKKDRFITNLHVIHHALLPIFFWFGLRTETSFFQMIPSGINAFVHVIMYTYYGLSAMGPEVQKMLWWKKHLTRIQMGQFIVILITTFVLGPVLGCMTHPLLLFLDVLSAVLFFSLFLNFYVKTYRKAPPLKGKDH